MKNTTQRPDFVKRKLLALLLSMPLFAGCEAPPVRAAREASQARDQAYYEDLSPEEKRLHESLKNKFHGIYGGVLVLGAIPKKNRISITNERGVVIAKPSNLGSGLTDYSTYGGGGFPIPKTVRATWRQGAGWNNVKKVWNEGTIIGDYTVPVAERIPDSILDYIRENGGALRVKIVLKDDGILIGWDVEEWYTTQYGRGLRWVLPGGDFQEAKIFNGEVVRKGWYIDKSGQKIETDW